GDRDPRGGAPRRIEGENPRTPQEAGLPSPRDRLVGRARADPRVRGPPGRDLWVVRVAAGPRGHELPHLGRACARGAPDSPGGGCTRGWYMATAAGADLGDGVPAMRS